MPGYERAELTGELKVHTSARAERSPREQVEAALRSAGASGLAHEAGPETVVFAGERREVLEALTEAVEAALDAGARGADLRVEVQGDAGRFGRD